MKGPRLSFRLVQFAAFRAMAQRSFEGRKGNTERNGLLAEEGGNDAIFSAHGIHNALSCGPVNETAFVVQSGGELSKVWRWLKTFPHRVGAASCRTR